jgi:hypothetical protein
MSDRTAPRLHADLLIALKELRQAEKNAMLLFAEILRRKLYRELGFSNIHLYSNDALGFSRTKTFQFIRLAQSLDHLPMLRKSIEKDEVPWTKARVVAKVATPETERRWVAEAKRSSRRDLELKAKIARAKTKTPESELSLNLNPKENLPAAPIDLRFRMTPDQFARFELLIELLRKKGRKIMKEDLLLEALDALLQSEECTRVHSSNPYQIVVNRCEECGESSLPTSRGNLRLDAASAEAISCDARVLHKGRNQSSVTPALRARILARDGHQCSTAGCHHRRFLEIHHRKPRAKSGNNHPDNLVTLCSACHKQEHRR